MHLLFSWLKNRSAQINSDAQVFLTEKSNTLINIIGCFSGRDGTRTRDPYHVEVVL